ncbi:hypothetical protein [Amycolatopsis sp. WAC 01376]|nr:hypothetical protein [Amycolatopsis sp. WAC 01376]
MPGSAGIAAIDDPASLAECTGRKLDPHWTSGTVLDVAIDDP